MFDKTVTVLNGKRNKSSIIFIPTVFHNCEFQNTKGANIITSGVETANTCTLIIKKESFPKEFMLPLDWAKLDDIEASNYFTSNPADDYFVIGSYEDIMTAADFENFRKQVDSIFKMNTSDNLIESPIPSLQIGGV